MDKQRFREVLKEYGISLLTTIKPEDITETELRESLDVLIDKNEEK